MLVWLDRGCWGELPRGLDARDWHNVYLCLLYFLGKNDIPSLKLTCLTPENRPTPQRKDSSSNHPFFGGTMLVFHGVSSFHPRPKILELISLPKPTALSTLKSWPQSLVTITHTFAPFSPENHHPWMSRKTREPCSILLRYANLNGAAFEARASYIHGWTLGLLVERRNP